jgi:5-methylcytosine-specific restriction endonuclease McrA
MEEIRRCSSCGRFLGENSFRWRDKKKGIRRNDCKKCQDVRHKIWSDDNVEHLKQYKRLHYDNNHIRYIERSLKWYQDNKEYRKGYCKQWRQDNNEYKKESDKRWRQDNRDKVRGYSRKHIALKAGAEGLHTIEDLKYIYNHQQGKCPKCRKFIPFDDMTVDHIIPLSWGGNNYASNIQLLCKGCNSSKSNLNNTDFRDYVPLFLDLF